MNPAVHAIASFYAAGAGASLVIGFFALFMAAGRNERPLWGRFMVLSFVNTLFCTAGTLQGHLEPGEPLRTANLLNNMFGMFLAPAFLNFVQTFLRRRQRVLSASAWGLAAGWALVFLAWPEWILTRHVNWADMPLHYYRYTIYYYVFLMTLFTIIVYALITLWRHGHKMRNWRRDMRWIYPACVIWCLCGLWDSFFCELLRLPYAISWAGGASVVIAFLSAVVARSQEAFRIEEQHHLIVKELEDARTIQGNLITYDFPKFDRVGITGLFIPAEQVGGDFYEVRRLDEHHAALFLSDVTGHGIASAFITAMMKVSLESLPAAMLFSPPTVMEHLNQTLAPKMAGRFATAIYGIMNTTTLTFEYCSAGQDPPILWLRAGEALARELPNVGRLLGVFPQLELATHTFQLGAGDKLLLATDGVCDEPNLLGEMYTLARLKAVFENPNFSGLADIFRDVMEFTGDKVHADDDMAALLVEIS